MVNKKPKKVKRTHVSSGKAASRISEKNPARISVITVISLKLSSQNSKKDLFV